jgi:hypothetical protein
MSMTQNEKAPEALGLKINRDPVAATTVIYEGAIVCLDSSGNAVMGSSTTGLVARGVNKRVKVDNSTGLAGDLYVESEGGVFGLKNKSGDEVTAAEIGDVCYISDNNEVCKTSTSKSVAGVVVKLEAGLVFVSIGLWPLQVGLLSANNLSDVGSASAARASIGANKGHFTFEKVSSKAADAEVARWVVGADIAAGVVTGFKTVLNGALATADATVQLKINGTNVGSTTTGLITQAFSGSAAGDVDTATPLTTALTFAPGDVISVTCGGGSTATGTFNATVSYTF